MKIYSTTYPNMLVPGAAQNVRQQIQELHGKARSQVTDAPNNIMNAPIM